MILMISAMFVVFGSIAIAAQDTYTLKSGKLSFADSGATRIGRFACHTTVASKDYIFTEYPKH
jgi:hypothetical protein